MTDMVGIDLVYLPEFQKQLKLGGQTFLSKTFNDNELKNDTLEHLAGVWAAKEAVLKAIGKNKMKMADITIDYKDSQPQATYRGKKFDISITHHGDYAVAVAVGDDK
jgi:NAD(P)H-hydrate epimerase